MCHNEGIKKLYQFMRIRASNLDKFEYICRDLTHSWQILLWIEFFHKFPKSQVLGLQNR